MHPGGDPKTGIPVCKEECVMSSTPVGTIVKKSLGWSIGLSVLLIVAGLPSDRGASGGRNRGEHIRRLGASFQRRDPFGVCLVHAHHWRSFVGAAGRDSLYLPSTCCVNLRLAWPH
jgi:hypothetical protein